MSELDFSGEVQEVTERLAAQRARIAELEAENTKLRGALADIADCSDSDLCKNCRAEAQQALNSK